MTEPIQPATPTAHAAHDPTWIAALAARDHGLAPDEHAQATALLATCDACTDLYADLVGLSAAVPTAAIPARPRSYTITAADAARLRPAGWRRFFRAIGSARDGITFPLAMGLTTIGIAGLLVATLPTLGGAGGAKAGPTTLSAVGAPAAAGQESLAIGAETDQNPDELGGIFYGGDEDTASPDQRNTTAAAPETAPIREDASGTSVLIVLAGTLLIVGLGLFALRWTARRL